MGLFHRNSSDSSSDLGSQSVMESIQRATDMNALIYLDPCENFNTNSVITVAPNEQAIFIKNGELYGILPSGRHEIKTENYPILSRIRDILTGGQSSFSCQVYHVCTAEQNVNWGTSSAIEVQDFYLGRGEIGVPTLIRGAGEFRVRFNIREDENASVQTFMRLMGDRSIYTVDDLAMLFRAQISEEISYVVGQTLEQISMSRSINAISSQLKPFSRELLPTFENLFNTYGLELVNFSFYNLTIDETEQRQKYLDRRIAAANVADARYNQAVQQELLKDVAVNPGAGGIASAGAGLGMGITAGSAFAEMATTAFATIPQNRDPQNVHPQTMGFGNRFGTVEPQPQTNPEPVRDPLEALNQLQRLLDAGYIDQARFDAKKEEILSRL